MMNIHDSNEKKENFAVCVVGDFKFLRKYLKKFINNLRKEGKYKGDVVVITSKLTPIFLYKLSNFKNVHFLKFKRIKFDKKTEASLKSLDTGSEPNRHINKNFQWNKLHLFDINLKKWDFIFYMDINMTIHKNLSSLFNIKPVNKIFANQDYSLKEEWTLGGQFDNTKPIYRELENNYDLNIKNYFQSGILYFDTNIIEVSTKNKILDIVRKYPISKTNEQGILNIYFLFIKKLFKVMPQNVDGLTTYSYWKKNDSVMITKQLTDQYK